MVPERVELPSFTTEMYASGIEMQRAYIAAIFRNLGLEHPSVPFASFHSATDSKLALRFYNESGYGSETRLGQLVQLLACEASAIASGKTRVIREARLMLEQIRSAKHILGDRIFGEQVNDYLDCAYRYFYAHRFDRRFIAGGIKMQDRNAALRDFVQNDIAVNFPLTSR